ncbi:MAG TPA: flavodoxin family protein [Candidatus Gallacutalibacter stercoravium]|nr:flavodoxin family protein [Candidatus Gallacutalibacter stercoravium]
MNKRICVISGSPRKEGNSDTLCDEFQKGCQQAGHQVVKICLREKEIHFCNACYACKKTGVCVQQDDVFEILQEMAAADVIVLATPVYFYSMAGQVKTLIDRCLASGAKLAGKEFYFIATAAAEKNEMERTIDALRGFTDCLPGSKVCGVIYGAGAWQLGDIKGNPAMQEAYQMGKSIC